MAAGDLTDRATVAAIGRITDPDTATWGPIVDRLVSVASQAFKSETQREITQTTHTAELYDGCGDVSDGKDLFLREWPLVSIPTVTENGVALTVGTGYDTTKDVLYDGARGLLIRQNVTWAGWNQSSSPGRQNISVTYIAGYKFPRGATGLEIDLPWDIEQWVIELTNLLFKEGPRAGEQRKDYEGWALQFIRTMNPAMDKVLERYTRGPSVS